jgi:hypothetical protein
MLAGCSVAMSIGLVLDTLQTPIALLAALCLGAESLLGSVRLHWQLLPVTHWAMLGAALAAIGVDVAASASAVASRVAAHAVCVLAMFAGMALAMQLARPDLLGASHFVIVMFGGMAAGMLVSLPLYRCEGQRSRDLRAAPAQAPGTERVR